MRILEINGGVFGSTGKIMFGIAEAAEAAGHEVLCAAPVTKTNRNRQPSHPYVRIGNYYSRLVNVLLSRLTGLHDCFAWLATARFLRRVKAFAPDVIHLHNLHGSYLNLPMLFRYIKSHRVPVVWTLHDCWSFTGGCPCFDIAGCEKWRDGCYACPQYRDYPKSYVDSSKILYRLKKKWFSGVKRITIITPSKWLEELAQQSFLQEYPIQVIHNGIDLSVFRPTNSDFRAKHQLEDKVILLGVAFGWGVRKGLDVFVELSRRLDDRYQIVLVGTDEQVERQLPKNILSIHRTQNQQELAEIYSAADLFVNPTREENYPTVNMEALACGTPVVTFCTGGSPEIPDDTCGIVVDKDDVDALEQEILRQTADRVFTAVACCERAKSFDGNYKFREYVSLFDDFN